MASTMKASSNQIAPCLPSVASPYQPQPDRRDKIREFPQLLARVSGFWFLVPITGQVCQNHRLFANLVTPVWPELAFERHDQTTVPTAQVFPVHGQRGPVSTA